MSKQKTILLLWCLLVFTPLVNPAQKYKHKTEAEIAALTPAQRVDEWINESVHHDKYWETDHHHELIRKYELLDGMKAVPRFTELIESYDPTKFREGKGDFDDRFDATYYLLHFIDSSSVRLRSAEEGRKAIEALERAAERLRKSKYDTDPNTKYLRKEMIRSAESYIKEWKGIGWTDDNIQNTFRFVYKIKISDEELAKLSDFLTARYPDYPSWSAGRSTIDNTEIGPAGYPVVNVMLVKPERYYEVYLEFKKSNPYVSSE